MSAMHATAHRPALLVAAIALLLAGMPTLAQQHDHHEHAPPPAGKASAATPNQSQPQPQAPQPEHPDDHTHQHVHPPVGAASAATPTSPQPQPQSAPDPQPVDHAAMGHDMQSAGPPAEPMDHSQMDHAAMGHAMPDHADPDLPADAAPREPIPPVTPEALAAAFPPSLGGHAVHDHSVHSMVLLDRLEAVDTDDGTGVAWEALAWRGTDLDRLWVRSEGEGLDGELEAADLEVFYGRAIARWWDGVAGLRHDFGEGPSQTFAAIGVMGLAPYKFEVEATAYLGQGGQTGAAFEVEYETLFTNRLILQWLAEAEAYGRDDPRRGIGSGLSTVEAGLRLRYEFHRQFAPYVGVTWERAYGNTADLRAADGEAVEDTRLVAGVRFWF